ncbi:DUF748 domain-containing protein [Sansalvadorimonas sp. 2012CJ34-2]|uniref:DUF748 domain-containing protein n=1 Tax=Parendozoicomonas callyspongiae TaxID=2942213 RepID=A0ABT0PL37_9GAMM|nr:DUF748 domain-containing protein [Sansalvadorimonas sp. 2012CJ34-2]MCL6272084.1 DUF748 domain-containing protein [Sansalvadorimonas sp. 2012CJ34-2]
MWRFISIFSKTFLAYAFCGFVLLPAAVHYAIYYFHPQYLTQPLSVGAVRFNPLTLKLEVEAVRLGDSDNVLAGFHEVTLDASWRSLTQKSVVLDGIELVDPYTNIAIDKSGRINLAAVLRKQPATDTKPEATESSSLAVALDNLSVVNARIKFSDSANTGDQPFNGILDRVYISAKELSWPETRGDIDLKARLNNSGLLNSKVTLEPGNNVAALIGLDHIPLPDIQPYLSPYTYLQLDNGELSGQIQAEVRQGDKLSVSGDTSITSILMTDERSGQHILGWNKLAVTELAYGQDGVEVTAISLDKPEVTIEIDNNLKLNLAYLVKPQPDSSDKTSAKTEDKESLKVDIGSFVIGDGLFNFSDTSFNPGFSAPISNLSGQITNIHTGSGALADIQLDGAIDKYSPVSISGSLDPAEPFRSTKIKMDFSEVELTTLTPYSGRFAGYNIEKGRMNLELDYSIEKKQLNARNIILLKHLTLGKKVDSPDATQLPLKLAIALLKNSDGEIDVDLPIKGNLDDPEFEFGPLIRTAIVNFITNIVKAPFKFLASLVSGDADEMSSVLFKAGDDLLSVEHDLSLKHLADALKSRPELVLEVEGRASRELDAIKLAEHAVEKEVHERYTKMMADVGKLISIGDIVPEETKAEVLRAIGDEKGLKAKKSMSSKELLKHITQQWPVSDIELRELAIRRAKHIKDSLVDKGLDAHRVYILDAKTSGFDPAESRAGKKRIASKLNLTTG